MKSLARNWIFSTLNFLHYILFLARQERLHELNIQLASSQTFETRKLGGEKMIGISERVACIEEDFQVVQFLWGQSTVCGCHEWNEAQSLAEII